MDIATIYSELSKGQQRAIYAPGLMSLLAILGLGSSGTLKEKLTNLFGNQNKMISYVRSVNLLDENPEIKSQTLVCINSDIDVYEEFYNKIRKLINIWHSDFSDDDVKKLNAWIEHQAGFSNTFKTSDLTDMALVALNTLWFKDEWVHKFNQNNTYKETFTKNDGSVIELQMMHQTKNIKYFDNGNIKGIQLDFKNGAVAEFVLGLPSTVSLTTNFEFIRDEVRLTLPRFTIESDINLRPILQKMELQDLFVNGSLKEITDNPLFVSQAHQKIYTRFDEEGAEVKVATRVMIPLSIQPVKKVIEIRFDHPFHFRIIKNGISLVDGYYNGS